jgi:hypothetical protein
VLRDASLWKPLLPFPKTANALAGLEKLSGYYAQAIASGMSFGIFDTQYRFKQPSLAARNQMLHWRGPNSPLDPGQTSFEMYGASQMRDSMDFPLVCMALSVDAFAPGDARARREMLSLIPLQQQLSSFLASLSADSSGGKTKGKHKTSALLTPTDYGQVLVRSGCVTRLGYEGQGLATALNHFVMLEAKAWGFKGIKVALNSASLLRSSYSNPPPGCRTEILAHWDFEDIEMHDEYGTAIRPYLGSGLKDGWEVWCDLAG